MFEYPKLTSQTDPDGKRVYFADGHSMPSVTTILKATQTEETKNALANWSNRIGEEKAKKTTKYAANVGSLMHKNIENHLNGNESEDRDNSFHGRLAKMMAEKIITNGLTNLTQVYGIEVQLYYPYLYSGTADMTGGWRGNPAIIDFKQSLKKKKEEWVDDYKIQLAAYAMAHNQLFPTTKISTGIIMMCTQKLEYQEFVIEGAEFERYCVEWARRVDQYYIQ